MIKKISIAILSIIFIFVLAPSVFASVIEVKNVNVDNQSNLVLYDFGNRNFSVTQVVGKAISGDWPNVSLNIGDFFNVAGTSIATGEYIFDFVGGIGQVDNGIANFYIIGEYVGGGTASNDLTTIMGAIITSSIDLTTTVFTTYWPFVLVIGIIGALLIVFVRLFKVFR